MAKQYKLTVTITVGEDLKEKILNREDLPNHCWEPTPAREVIMHAAAGLAWDLCDDAGLNPRHMNYDMEEVVDDSTKLVRFENGKMRFEDGTPAE